MSKHVGSKLEDFLQEEDILEDAQLLAAKKIIAHAFLAKMKRDHVSRSALARRMRTSRTVVNRLLDPTDTSFTFATLSRASRELDLKLLVSVESRAKRRRHQTQLRGH